MCRDGEIGRHVRLKIWWTEMSVPVRLWLSVHKMSHSNNRLVRHPFKVEIRVRVPCVIRYNFIIFFTWWRWCNWLAYRTVTAKLTVRFRHDTQHHGFLADMVYALDWKSRERGSSPRESTNKIASFSQMLMNDVLKWNNASAIAQECDLIMNVVQLVRTPWREISVRVGTFSKCLFSSYSGV